MDDDAPDDVAHRALRRAAVPRPPARAATRRATASTVAGHHARRRARRSSAATTAPSTWWSRSPARSTTTRCSALVERALRRRAPRAASGPQRTRARRPSGDGRGDRRRHRAGAHRHGRPRRSPATDPRREALDVVNHVLGGGLSSRLFEEIRERRGLAYAVYSGVVGLRRRRACSDVRGHPARARRRGAASCCATSSAKLVADGITDDELDIAVGYLTGSFELGLEDTGCAHGPHRPVS